MESGWRQGFGIGGCLLLVAGASGVTVLYKYRHSLSHKLVSWRIRRLVRVCRKKVYVVDSEEAWTSILPRLLRDVDKEGALGLDCEWTDVKGRRRPVALLQLASYSGTCVLVRLSAFTTPLPASLQSVLGDASVIKAGVGIIQDKRYLETDYGVQVEGCVDLCHLVMCRQESGDGGKARESGTSGLGLAALSLKYLGHTLDKDWRLRRSNWEAEHLTQRQKNYAAMDALVGMQLLMVLCAKLRTPGGEAGSWLLPFLPPPFFRQHLMADIHKVCHLYRDLKFSNASTKSLRQDNGLVHLKPSPSKLSQATGRDSSRQSPLYNNCQLLAPDDSILSTCDTKKAKWYIEKGLGVELQRDPLVVRLNFEPARRPQAECEDDQFYTLERHNLCVVCGQEHTYLKKNVVPQEYRKHFPGLLKDRQSHDIVPMCIRCHRISNAHDVVLRETLAKECNTPCKWESRQQTRVRNAAKALLKSRAKIPEARVTELEDVIKVYFAVDSVSQELLEEAVKGEGKEWTEDHQSHGQLVCEVYMRKGLVKLQHRWRQHFLDTMQPKYMPRHWSVTHGLQKMWDTMAGLSGDHPDLETYKMVLIGTDNAGTMPESTC